MFDMYLNLFFAAILVFVLNIPFGYWRSNVRKFSLQWILAIHLPVPIIVLLRETMQLGYHWTTYPIMIFAFFTGQSAGKLIYNYFSCRPDKFPGSCLIMDLVRNKQKV